MSSDLKALAIKLGTSGPHKILPTTRLIQLLHDGIYILRTTKAVFVWEHPYYPQLYIPISEFTNKAAVDPSLEITQGETYKHPETNQLLATQLLLKTPSKPPITRTLSFSPSLPAAATPLQSLVKLDFSAVDRWFEETSPIYIHPRDPFKRIDILPSTRPLRISIAGHPVASTTASCHLYETGLPTRYYVPFTSVNAGLLRRSGTKTACPYKGEAEYYSVEIEGKVYEDVVWYYDCPLPESAGIKGLLCFYNEKVTIHLDGQELERAVTHFSNAKPGVAPSAV